DTEGPRTRRITPATPNHPKTDRGVLTEDIEAPPVISPSASSHIGRGGSLGVADPEHGNAFGYAMNNIIGGPNDVRATLLVDAVQMSLA
ncbi:hypothetical protein LCH29_26650, partial [Streptomyces sp. BRA346]